MKKICVFASGQGTNALNIIRYFGSNSGAEVALVICNKPDAPVVSSVRDLGIPVSIFNRESFYSASGPRVMLEKVKPDLIVLAGFLWLLPEDLIRAYDGKIVNIHPALLPKFGGKGMYGFAVHQAVIAANEKESGITIHYVNEKYDEGRILLQKTCTIEPGETPESLSKKIRTLEHLHYPPLIETLLSSSCTTEG